MSKIMKFLCLSLLLATLVLPTALAAEKTSNATEIQVSGSYQEELVPDIAYINIGTLTEADTVNEAQTQNAGISTKLRQQLENLGIKADDIKTAHYTVMPLYKYDDNGRRNYAIKGYQVTNSITVTTSPDKAGEVIDAALTAGGNQINQIQFSKKDDDTVRNAALAQAVRDALSKADAIAAALNKHVARVKTVNETGISMQSPETSNRLYSSKMMVDTGAATPISAGLVHLTANVQVVVELE